MLVCYNGITLHRCLTKNWEETVEYDSTGMNLIGSRILLTFEGTVMPKYAMSGGRRTTRGNNAMGHYADYPDLYGEGSINTAIQVNAAGGDNYQGTSAYAEPVEATSFTARLNLILRQLQMPRGHLGVFSDLTNECILEAYGYESQIPAGNSWKAKYLDVNGGPKPKSVTITEMYSEYARISFTIEVFRIRCLGGEIEAYLSNLPSKNSYPGNGFIVSNRCWTEETIDKNFYITRVYSGRLRISSTEKSVHYYRSAYYPPLEPGFKRESVRFTESEDGLELSYVVTDKQTRISAPYPATEFSGNVRYNVENSSVITVSIDLTLIGRPDADKSMLVERGMYAMGKKISQFTANGKYGGYQRKFEVSETLGDPPAVSFSAVYQLHGALATKPSAASFDGILEEQWATGFDQIGRPMDFNIKSGEGQLVYVKKHNRFKSANPNPFGYTVFTAYDAEAPAEAAEAAQDSFLGYIKCLATTPCGFDSFYVDSKSTAWSSEVKDLTTTVVYQDSAGTQYATAQSTEETEAIIQPFSFYKSDITYYTDYSRFVLPQAKPASGDPTSRSDIYNIIWTLESEIDGLKQQLGMTPAPVIGEGGGDEEEPPAEETPPPSTDELTSTLVTKQAELERMKRLLNNTLVIQLARPVPKAVVTIEAERFGRLPEFPDPNKVVSCEWDDPDEEPLYFTPLKCEIKLGEPRPGKNTTATVSYNATATYEYVLSRDYKQGDRVWLLNNPTFGAKSYFPRDTAGNIVPEGLTTLFDGYGLDHGNLNPNETATPIIDVDKPL